MGEVIKKYYFTAYEQGEREKREKSDSLLTLSSSSDGMWTEWGGGVLLTQKGLEQFFGLVSFKKLGQVLWFG